MQYGKAFLQLAHAKGVLGFGEFITKAGRKSPYFFNSGLFNDGDSLLQLSKFYAKTIIDSGISFDMLFGPAYKGIPLVAATAMSLSQFGYNLGFCFNRKEAKDHGEGGRLVGAPLAGKVLILDDVISAGTSVRESVNIIREAGATPVGVVIALDRMERGQAERSAVQEVMDSYQLPVIAVATLDDLIGYLSNDESLRSGLDAVNRYRGEYGV